jgi:hypothetical protein
VQPASAEIRMLSEIGFQESENLPESLQFLGPDKVRERDPVLRLMCVEILMLLAASKQLQVLSI